MTPQDFDFASPDLAPADESQIRRLIDSYGHIMDSGEWHNMTRVFTDDVTFDLSEFGWGVFVGVDELLKNWASVQHPVGHHMTNIVISGSPNGYRAVTKGISVMADGSCRSNVYLDVLRHTSEGWRISHRRVHRSLGSSR